MKKQIKKDKKNRAQCWNELRKKFDNDQNFIENADKKGWAKYLSSIYETSSSLIEFNPYYLLCEHVRVATITHPKNRKVLENLARENLLSPMLRLREILVEIYDYEKYNYPLKSFKNLLKNKEKSAKGFPLLTFIFTYYPSVFFHPSKEIVDSLDLSSSLSCLSHPNVKQDKKGSTIHYLKDLENLLKYIDAFSAYEPFSFYSEKWYRDHLLHSIRVMWMMEKIIWDKGWYEIYQKSSDQEHRLKKFLECKNYENKLSLPDIYSDFNIGGRLKNECLRNSLIAGLFHDLMYPVSSFFKKGGIGLIPSKMRTEIRNLGKVIVPFFENRFLEGDLRSAIQQYFKYECLKSKERNLRNAMEQCLSLSGDNANQEIERLNDCYKKRKSKDKYVKMFLQNSFNHGVLGGVWLKSLPLESRQAIALHNIENVKIDPMEAPIAFFLVLCDEAQEWGRWIKSDNNPEEFFVPCEKIQWEVGSRKFRVKVSFKEKANEINKYKPEFDVKKLVNDKFKSLSRLIVPEDFKIEFLVIGPKGERVSISCSSSNWIMRTI
jgi:hypothetical protein